MNLSLRKPSTSDELLKISGFGKVKVEKYGVEIIEIIKKYV
ncbi:HRDC domain-containing protein [Anaerobacillus arseniciselenatis]